MIGTMEAKILEIYARGERVDELAFLIKKDMRRRAQEELIIGENMELPLGWPTHIGVKHIEINGETTVRGMSRELREALVNNLAGSLEHTGVVPRDIYKIIHGPVAHVDGRKSYVVVVGYETKKELAA